ncbi:MAG: hypothetical protein RLZZ186_583 [Cyanobacteriota bacterium]
MLLIAQLIAPPLQPGPVRLPEVTPGEQGLPRPQDRTSEQDQIQLDLSPEPPEPDRSPDDDGGVPALFPKVEGSLIYRPEQLRQIFASCGRSTPSATLQACAAALSARFEADGYINTRVYVLGDSIPGALEVVEGRLAEIRVITANPQLSARVRRLLRPLQGTVLNLPALDRQIQYLKRQGGIDLVQGSIGRLGSDVSQATLTLWIDPSTDPIRGDLSLRNEGNAGYGQWRAVATMLQNNLLRDNDTLLLYAEGDMDDTPELGAVITSLSYVYPLSENFRLNGSFGYSRRNLVEGPLMKEQWSFRQFQGYGQLEWVFKESLRQRWYAFGGVSLNRNDSYASGRPFALLNTLQDFTTNTGFFRFGVGVNSMSDRSIWSATLYGLQSANGFSYQNQLTSLGNLGIEPAQATAFGVSAVMAAAIAPNASLAVRGAGQIALNPLIEDMGFTIGSDTGIRGLPGQAVSGDSGYLGSFEIAWSVWQRQRSTVQLVPFVGFGFVNRIRDIRGSSNFFNDDIGAGGVLARVITGIGWQIEIGWVSQFNHVDQSGNAIWGDKFLLGNGVYTNVKYVF